MRARRISVRKSRGRAMTIQFDDMAACIEANRDRHGNLRKRRYERLAALAARRRQRDVSAAGRSDGGSTVLLLNGGHWVVAALAFAGRAFRASSRWSAFCTMRCAALSGCRRTTCRSSIRYVDWMIAMPLQVLALYFLVQTVASAPTGLFWRLLIASVAHGARALYGRDRSALSDAGLPDRAHPLALCAGRALFRAARRDQSRRARAIRCGSASSGCGSS